MTLFAGLFLLLARGIARIARGLLLGFQRGFRRLLFRLQTERFGSDLRGEFGIARLLLKLGRFAQLLGFRTRGGLRLPFRSLLQDSGIVGAGLGLEFLEYIFPGVLRGSLPVSETRLLKTHRVDFFLFRGMSGGL